MIKPERLRMLGGGCETGGKTPLSVDFCGIWGGLTGAFEFRPAALVNVTLGSPLPSTLPDDYVLGDEQARDWTGTCGGRCDCTKGELPGVVFRGLI